jgi:hypothetical protein
MADKESREWNIKEQAEKARTSFEERPSWMKSISHFSGTNTAASNGKSEKVEGEKSKKTK